MSTQQFIIGHKADSDHTTNMEMYMLLTSTQLEIGQPDPTRPASCILHNQLIHMIQVIRYWWNHPPSESYPSRLWHSQYLPSISNPEISPPLGSTYLEYTHTPPHSTLDAWFMPHLYHTSPCSVMRELHHIWTISPHITVNQFRSIRLTQQSHWFPISLQQPVQLLYWYFQPMKTGKILGKVLAQVCLCINPRLNQYHLINPFHELSSLTPGVQPTLTKPINYRWYGV